MRHSETGRRSERSRCFRITTGTRVATLASRSKIPIWRRYRSGDPADGTRAQIRLATEQFRGSANALLSVNSVEAAQLRPVDRLILSRAMRHARDAFLGLVNAQFLPPLRRCTAADSGHFRCRGPACVRDGNSTRAKVLKAAALTRLGAELLRRVALRERQFVDEAALRLMAPTLQLMHQSARPICRTS